MGRSYEWNFAILRTYLKTEKYEVGVQRREIMGSEAKWKEEANYITSQLTN